MTANEVTSSSSAFTVNRMMSVPFGLRFALSVINSGFEIDISEKNDLSESDHNIPAGDIYYIVSDYNDYELGSKAEFMGKIFYIKEKKAESREGYLIFTYKLCDKQYIKSTQKCNKNITGSPKGFL